jgi:secreted trypsin-like serine protease
MRRVRALRLLALVGSLVAVILAPANVSAITFGHLDGNDHPYAGAMVVQIAPGTFDVFCTGTLIAPTVFMTAGHCTDALASAGIDPHDVWVTFDPTFSQSSPLIRGTYHTHPEYGYSGHGGFSEPHDIAVIVLDHAAGNTPAHLPTLNLLNHVSKSQVFTAVGYGTVREDKTKGPHSLFWDPQRRAVDNTMNSLTATWLKLSMNPSTGDGGTCYGDSGGPHFLKGTDVVVALTVTGDAQCRATDVDYRVDTASARAFLGQYAALP